MAENEHPKPDTRANVVATELVKNGDDEAREGAGVARLRTLPNCVEGSNFKAKERVPELP